MSPDDRFVLDAAGLSGRPAVVQDAAGGGTALVVDVSSNEMLDVWATARSAVARPPPDPDDAWQLAFEHYTLAENTLVTTAVALRHHARLLSDLDRWVLFSRP